MTIRSSRRSWPRLLLLATVCILPGSAYGSQIPDLIFDEAQPQNPPYWVSASEALDESGKLRSDYLYYLEYLWEFQSRRGEVAKQGCLEQGAVYGDPLPHQVPVHSLAQLREYSFAIVRGTVAEMQPGFLQHTAGLMLRLDPIEIIAGDITANDAPLYIYYPRAQFTVGSYSFCKVDPRAPHEPEIGDQFLIFVREGVGGPERRFVGYMPEDMFLETREGKLLVPDDLRDDPRVASARSLDDIEAAISAGEGER